MKITVGQLYLNSAFRSNINVIGGVNGLNRKVKHVAVMEVSDFVEKCEGNQLFVLTTFSFNSNEEYINNVFNQLIEKEISALGVKIDRYITEIPNILIETANSKNIPLFIIKKEVLFSKLISDLDSLIINQQFNIINQLNEQHKLLYTSILHGENLDKFLKRTGSLLNKNCFCIVPTGKILSEYLIDSDNLSNRNELIDIINSIIKNNKFRDMDLENEQFINGKNTNFYVYPCIARNKLLGFFAVQSTIQMSEIDLMLAQQTNSFLTINLLHNQLELEVKERITSTTISEILLNYNYNEFYIKEKLQTLGVSPLNKYIILIISPSLNYKETTNIYNQKYDTKVIRNIIQSYSKNFILKPFLDFFISIISFNIDSGLNNINILQNFLEDFEKNDYIQSRFKIACSSFETDYKSLSELYTSTKKTLSYGITFFPNKTIYFYDDFISIRMISNILNSKEHIEIMKNIIEPLYEYDENNNGQLIETIRACISNETLENAAKELYIHINSLRYRLEKIYNLTNVNYFNGDGKYLLTNAYYLYILNKIR